MSELAKLVGSTFIERRDVKARQLASGIYNPVWEKWTRQNVEDHLDGTATWGHYLVSPEGNCRVFVYDLDLNKVGCWQDDDGQWQDFNPREAWQDANHPSRRWQTIQLRCLAEGIAGRANRMLDVPTVISYSGNKGMHVYGLIGTTPAEDARASASYILDSWGCFELIRGKSFYRHVGDGHTGYPTIGVEVYPKQDTVGDGLGNLVRLPLGINRKSGNPGYMIDVNQPYDVLVPGDPTELLTNGISW